MLAAIYWATDSYILVFLYKTGVESPLACFLSSSFCICFIIWKSWSTASPGFTQIALMGLVAAAVTFSRLDLAFFALLVGVSIVFRGSPLRYLLPLDILAVIVSTVVAFITRLGISAYYDSSTSALIMIVASLLVKIPILYFFGLYERPSNWKPLPVLWKLLLAMVVGSIAVSGLMLLSGFLHIFPVISRVVLLRDAGIYLWFAPFNSRGSLWIPPKKGTIPVVTPHWFIQKSLERLA